MKFTMCLCRTLLVANVLLMVLFFGQVRAQNAQIAVSAGMSHVNNENVLSIGTQLRYVFESPLVVGLRTTSSFLVPLRIEASREGVIESETTDGTSTVNSLMLDVGLKHELDQFVMMAGISVGGVNVAHQRRGILFTYSETLSQPSFAIGAWAALQYRFQNSWFVGVGGTYDYSAHRRVIGTNSATGLHLDAIFAGPRAHVAVTIGKDLGVPNINDTSHYHLWLLAPVASTHPFSEDKFNEFNPGLGLHMRFDHNTLTWFLEAGAYQYSLSDLASYAGGGVYVDIVSDWLKLGLFGGVLVLNSGGSLLVTPALAPRLTADAVFGSVSVHFIPDGVQSAFGLTVALPLW